MAQVPEQGFLPDEGIVDISPRLTPRVSDPYPRRINYVSGRSLTAEALMQEREYWDGRAGLFARAMTPGIVRGLDLSLIDDTAGQETLRVSAGLGLTEDGADIQLSRSLTARIADIPVAQPLLEESHVPAGLIGFFLRLRRAISAPDFPFEDPCPVDPPAHAYDDLITQDAVELVWARLDRGDLVAFPEDDTIARPVPSEDDPGGEPVLLGQLSSSNVVVPPAPLLGRPDPVLMPTSIYRDLAATRLIAQELDAYHRGERPPWAALGLPIGVAQIAPTGRVLFIDRFATSRAGGAPRVPHAGPGFGAPARLRRARFDRFLEHLQDLRSEGAAVSPATRFFRTLPPVGVLPATEFDSRTMRCGFFPENYVVEAAPVQLAQLDSLLSARSSLAAFDLARRDYVQLLVPVPDHLFDPRLLIQEVISEEFDEAIRAAELRETQAAGARDQLMAAEAYVVAVMDPKAEIAGQATVIPENSRADGFKQAAIGTLSDLAGAFAGVPLLDSEEAALSVTGYLDDVAKINAGGAPASEFTGLKAAVTELSARLDKANDVTDMSFLRLQADIYRVRKNLAGESDATRLATSPVLANLALNTTGIESSKLIETLQIPKFAPVPTTALKAAPGTSGSQPADGDGDGSGGDGAGIALQPMFFSAPIRPISFAVATAAPVTPGFSAGDASAASGTDSFARALDPVETIGADTFKAVLSSITRQGNAGFDRRLTADLIDAKDIAWQSLIYGKSSPVRTLTIAERLKPSPAQEAKNSAVAAKAEIIRSLQDLGLNLENLALPVSASRVTLVPLGELEKSIGTLGATSAGGKILADKGYVPVDGDIAVISDKHIRAVARGTDGLSAANMAKLMGEVKRLYAHRLGIGDERLPGLVLSDRLDPDPQEPDEAAFFAAAVDALESAVSILRLFELRVHGYSQFLARLRQALLAADKTARGWADAVSEIDARIAEARHDQAVTHALKTEEQARIEALNARRREILDKHVDIVAFARPMTVERLRPAPSAQLFRPLSEILPACLERDEALPDELEEILEMLRDAPVGWFPEVSAALGKIGRPEHFHAIWRGGLDRAHIWLARNAEMTPRTQFGQARGRAGGKAASAIYHALDGVLAKRKSILATRVTRSYESVKGVSWRRLRDAAREEMSIDDLERGGRRGRDAAALGTKMLSQMGSVAACYLAGLRDVRAEIRLQWADRLGEYDAAIDLYDPTAIPSWGEIPIALRRELDVMHRWLFARIDPARADARGIISTLVRICLLLSSHAPTSSIIEGVVIETKTVSPGESFEVDIGKGAASVGMIATIGRGRNPGRGVIEDLIGKRALVRLTEAPGQRILIAPQEPVVFTPPVALKLATLEL